MLDNKSMVLILWTSFFSEVATAALATAFRKSGVRVKLVGLARGGATGASGLTLVPDVTLEQAINMADRTTVVVIPGTVGAVRRLDNDPRVRELLSRAHTNHAVFVTSFGASHEVTSLVRGQDAALAIEPYPPDQEMIEFADRLVATLSTTAQSKIRKATKGTKSASPYRSSDQL